MEYKFYINMNKTLNKSFKKILDDKIHKNKLYITESDDKIMFGVMSGTNTYVNFMAVNTLYITNKENKFQCEFETLSFDPSVLPKNKKKYTIFIYNRNGIKKYIQNTSLLFNDVINIIAEYISEEEMYIYSKNETYSTVYKTDEYPDMKIPKTIIHVQNVNKLEFTNLCKKDIIKLELRDYKVTLKTDENKECTINYKNMIQNNGDIKHLQLKFPTYVIPKFIHEKNVNIYVSNDTILQLDQTIDNNIKIGIIFRAEHYITQ